jgi:hypothetical protein
LHSIDVPVVNSGVLGQKVILDMMLEKKKKS